MSDIDEGKEATKYVSFAKRQDMSAGVDRGVFFTYDIPRHLVHGDLVHYTEEALVEVVKAWEEQTVLKPLPNETIVLYYMNNNKLWSSQPLRDALLLSTHRLVQFSKGECRSAVYWKDIDTASHAVRGLFKYDRVSVLLKDDRTKRIGVWNNIVAQWLTKTLTKIASYYDSLAETNAEQKDKVLLPNTQPQELDENGFPLKPKLKRQQSERSQLRLKLLQAKEELAEVKSCRVCLENEMDCVLLPCYHLACCTECADSITATPNSSKCPICVQDISGHHRVYWV